MAYYKISTKAALSVWDFDRQQSRELQEKGKIFAAKFGASPVFTSDVLYCSFYGITFPKGMPTYCHAALFTAGKANNNYSHRPKQKAPKGLGKEHKQLWDEWGKDYPARISREGYWEALGLDWGSILICGITNFRFKDVIYFVTGAKPNNKVGAIEITGTEYDSAYKGFKNDE